MLEILSAGWQGCLGPKIVEREHLTALAWFQYWREELNRRSGQKSCEVPRIGLTRCTNRRECFVEMRVRRHHTRFVVYERLQLPQPGR
jgi:hypothetical protein